MITIISGLPRSGTSLMMQMLRAGGMGLLTDFERKPDADNPRGYYEWEPAKLLPEQPGIIAQAEGKAVKVITQLLMSIPEGHEYKVIMMQRPLAEVLVSQGEMLRRRGSSSDALGREAMAKAFRDHLLKVDAWLKSRRDISIRRQLYSDLLQTPRIACEGIREFLGLDLNVGSMAGEVDPSLYRNRRP
ncbi:MAG: hypothetical protein WCA16_16320 [Candidatus Sulfotelmatobacter sp.]